METNIDTHLGRRLRRLRRDLGWTQDRLAAAIGVRLQQIHKYETNITTLSAARLWAVAQALGVTVDYFYEGLEGRAPERFASNPVAFREAGGVSQAVV